MDNVIGQISLEETSKPQTSHISTLESLKQIVEENKKNASKDNEVTGLKGKNSNESQVKSIPQENKSIENIDSTNSRIVFP